MQVQPSKILSQASQLAAQIEQLEVQLQGLLQGAQGLQEAKKPELGTALAEAFERGDQSTAEELVIPRRTIADASKMPAAAAERLINFQCRMNDRCALIAQMVFISERIFIVSSPGD